MAFSLRTANITSVPYKAGRPKIAFRKLCLQKNAAAQQLTKAIASGVLIKFLFL
ncbi:MAG: hypothetical protein SOH80_04215 [Eubacteriales bacterium]|jgi:hypothetical protein